MKKFVELIIKTQPFVPEFISGIVYLISSLNGIEEKENELLCFFTELSDDELNFIRKSLEGLQRESIIERFEIFSETIEQKNWNEEWEKTIQPIKVSDRIIIKPSFREYIPKHNEILITIDPKMSFGTGYHQSTRIMIRLIEKYIQSGMKVLDIGTGTGILAIVCAKLSAKEVITCDIDDFVEENVLENFSRNEVQDKCRFILGSLDKVQENDFDMILANIQKNVLLEMADEIKLKIRKDGYVVLSGLLLEDENDIISHYSGMNFKLLDKMTEDEWIGLVFQSL
ncbi:MAG: 50S ribosomal protein L11 methyltransferase [Ignavibacteria bacterium]|nr:50S ribosomal protein L11 methyltransferase [Ignavibacteria bacterium]